MLTRRLLPFLLALAASVSSEALEPYRITPPPATPTGGHSIHLAHGSTWLAVRMSGSEIHVVDRASGNVLLTLAAPAANTPLENEPGATRTVSNFGRSIAADGNRLAAVADSLVSRPAPAGSSHGSTVFLWDIPSGNLIGAADVPGPSYGSNNHLGLANGRLLMTDETAGGLRLWNSVTMQSLGTLPYPATFAQPLFPAFQQSRIVAMAGDFFVYRTEWHQSPQQLVCVDLAAGTFHQLPLPADYSAPLSGSSSLGMNGSHVLFPYSRGENSGPGLAHYRLSDRSLVTTTAFADPTYSGTLHASVAPSGAWKALLTRNDGTRDLLSGTHPENRHEAVAPGLAIREAYFPPFDFIDDELWLTPSNLELPGIVAYRQPAAGLVSSVLGVEVGNCDEAAGSLQVRVTASPAPAAPLSFRLSTSDGTALAASDYSAVDQTFTIAAGQSEKLIQIGITADTVLEPNESFFIHLTDLNPGALALEQDFPAVIRGTSFQLLSPVAAFRDDPQTGPTGAFLAGGQLLQANRSYNSASISPALVRKPFDSGDWQPSASWNRPVPHSPRTLALHGTANGLALIRDFDEVTLYDAANDEVRFRLNGSGSTNRTDAIGSLRFVSGLAAGPAVEYAVEAPHTARPVSGSGFSVYAAAYSGDLLFLSNSSGGIDSYRQSDGSSAGQVFVGGPWGSQVKMTGSENHIALFTDSSLWLFPSDAPAEIRRLDPAPGSSLTITGLSFADGYLFLNTGSTGVLVIEPETGVVVDTLLVDMDASVLPGAPAYSPSNVIRSFSPEANRAVALLDPNTPEATRIARLSRYGVLPSVLATGPVREGENTLPLALVEAASFPLTVTTRAIAGGANEAADWENSGATVVVPAGVTAFDAGVFPADDRLPEDPHPVALEITLSGNGHSETRRVSVRLDDNDRVNLADLPHGSPVLDRLFAATGGAWAYRGGVNQRGSFLWTGDADFIATTPYGWAADYAFPWNMAGSGEWLAVSHDTWGGTFGTQNPSSVFLFKPATQEAPVRILKGMKAYNRFGRALFTRGDTLWVGAPGTYGVNGMKKIQVKGGAYEYHMPTGKRVRTYKAPKDYVMNFGAGFTANDSSVWIASPAHLSRAGAVLQYSRTTGKWQRTIPVELGLGANDSGSRMTSNADTLVLVTTSPSAPAVVKGYSATSGALSWTLTPPSGQSAGAVEMIRDDLLAVGGSTIAFYQLAPATEPVLLAEIWSYEPMIAKMEFGGTELMVYRGEFSDEKWTLIDLRDIPQLASYFPPALAASATPAKVQVAQLQASPRLEKGPDGWTMSFGEDFPLGTIPGSEATLESSVDLTAWSTVARFNSALGWVPTVEWVTAGDGNSVKIQSNDPTRYFRLRLSTVQE